MVALITLNHMSATSVFFVVGLAYIVVGLFYRLPVPVQPLKAVAAIAIAGGVSARVISASGLVMAAFWRPVTMIRAQRLGGPALVAVSQYCGTNLVYLNPRGDSTMPPLLRMVSSSESGKTLVVETLIRHLSSQGDRVASRSPVEG